MKLTSSAFEANKKIPRPFSGEGADVSPALEWSDPPKNCREFALICDDPDAPKRPGQDHPFVHWIIYKISSAARSLPEGLQAQEKLDAPIRADQGTNSFGEVGYGGPMPPVGHGIHHYHFKLYALDTEINLPPRANKDELLRAMQGHILDSAELIGEYERVATAQ